MARVSVISVYVATRPPNRSGRERRAGREEEGGDADAG